MSPEFIRQISELSGAGELAEVLASTPPETSVRINPRKPGFTPADSDGKVPWHENGIYLAGRPVFTLMPELHSGAFYVQDASSMFASALLGQALGILGGDTPVAYLDACAAPGGKTTAAIDRLPEGSLVVANEYEPKRIPALRENLVRWGCPDVIVTRGDAAALGACGEMFDIIAADLPCSGEGMMRKEPEAVRQWSKALVKECAEMQFRIASALVPALRSGGFFIYSTCTFNLDENERNVLRLVRECGLEPVAISCADPAWGILPGEKISEALPPESCARFYPGKIRGEGQFAALLRKPGIHSPVPPVPPRKKQKPHPLAYLLRDPGRYVITPELTAFPLRYRQQLQEISAATKVVSAGLELGVTKGKDFIPSHALAHSLALNPDAFARVPLDLEEALSYLRGNAPRLPEGTPKGIVLLTYNSLPLGFAKNIGSRANTLLPSSARIHNL